MAKAKKPAVVKPLVLLEDEPIASVELDGLQLSDFAAIVSGAAAGTRGPFTIGVFGSWGTGKTSILRLAKAQLENSDFRNVVTVWFNAWQFEHERDPIVPLVASIIDQLQERLRERKDGVEKVSDVVKKGLSKLSNALRAVIYGIEAKSKVGVPGLGEMEIGMAVKEMVNRYEDLSQTPDPIVERTLYYNAFEALHHAASSLDAEGDKAGKVVVFIDDLDRCMPERAVRLLESIKLVLAQRGFIFALALDRPVVERYIDVVLSKALDQKDLLQRGAKYLDKLFQLPLDLPPHSPRFAEYVRRTMERSEFQSAAGAENQTLATVIGPLVETIGPAIDFNPRSFVRLINTLIVDFRLFPGNKKRTKEQQVMIFVVTRLLQHRLPRDEFDILCLGSTELRAAFSKGRGEAMTFLKAAAGDETAAESDARLFLRLYERFKDTHAFLDLLTSKAGKTWLSDDSGRSEVINFIRVAREEADIQRADVTEQLQKMVKDNRLDVTVSNASLGGDPAKDKLKKLTIRYSISGGFNHGGSVHTVVANEGQKLQIPKPGDKPGPIVILEAIYEPIT